MDEIEEIMNFKMNKTRIVKINKKVEADLCEVKKSCFESKEAGIPSLPPSKCAYLPLVSPVNTITAGKFAYLERHS